MESEVDIVANALCEKFKEIVSVTAGMTFEETGVKVPHRAIWLDYAQTAIEALDNERRMNK